jgi:putative transcriptional regulator
MRLLAGVLLVWAGAASAGDSIFLVSRKDMPDPNFHDTVVLVTHLEGATVGLILNRPTRLTLGEVFPEIEKNVRPGDRLNFGGPVSLEFVTYLVKSAVRPPESEEVAEGVYLASSPALLQGILAGDTKVEALRVFAGYAGWAPGQVEGEVSRGDWNVLPADGKTIFDKNPEKLWPPMHRRASATSAMLR